MKDYKVMGRAIRDLGGLKTLLLQQSYQLENLYSDENKPNQPFTCVCVADSEMKNPTATVNGFADNVSPQTMFTMTAPNGSKWHLAVDNAGAVVVTPVP